jgi:hypothetical protein
MPETKIDAGLLQAAYRADWENIGSVSTGLTDSVEANTLFEDEPAGGSVSIKGIITESPDNWARVRDASTKQFFVDSGGNPVYARVSIAQAILTGTVSVAAGGTAVSGVGTNFLSSVTAGQVFKLNADGQDAWTTVLNVVNDNALVLKEGYRGTSGAGTIGNVGSWTLSWFSKPSGVETPYNFSPSISVDIEILRTKDIDEIDVFFEANVPDTRPAGSGVAGSGSDNRLTRWSGTANVQNSFITLDDYSGVGTGHMYPAVTEHMDLGGSSNRWRVIYGLNANFTGDISVTGTVDGRDVGDDGALLDTAVVPATFTQKATLVAGTGVSSYAIVPFPTAGNQSLVSDAAEATGMKWLDITDQQVKRPTPQTSTDNAIVRWNGTTAEFVENSTIRIDDVVGSTTIMRWGTSSYIQGGSGVFDDMIIRSDDDIFINPDDDVFIQQAGVNWVQFDGSARNVQITSLGGASFALDLNSGDLGIDSSYEILWRGAGEGSTRIFGTSNGDLSLQGTGAVNVTANGANIYLNTSASGFVRMTPGSELYWSAATSIRELSGDMYIECDDDLFLDVDDDIVWRVAGTTIRARFDAGSARLQLIGLSTISPALYVSQGSIWLAQDASRLYMGDDQTTWMESTTGAEDSFILQQDGNVRTMWREGNSNSNGYFAFEDGNHLSRSSFQNPFGSAVGGLGRYLENHLVRSEDLSAGEWTKFAGVSIVSNDTADPYSDVTADRLTIAAAQPTNGSTLVLRQNTGPLTNGATYYVSFWVKGSSGFNNIGGDLGDGAAMLGATITDKWQKIERLVTAGVNDWLDIVMGHTNGTDTVVWFWGFQIVGPNKGQGHQYVRTDAVAFTSSVAGLGTRDILLNPSGAVYWPDGRVFGWSTALGRFVMSGGDVQMDSGSGLYWETNAEITYDTATNDLSIRAVDEIFFYSGSTNHFTMFDNGVLRLNGTTKQIQFGTGSLSSITGGYLTTDNLTYSSREDHVWQVDGAEKFRWDNSLAQFDFNQATTIQTSVGSLTLISPSLSHIGIESGDFLRLQCATNDEITFKSGATQVARFDMLTQEFQFTGDPNGGGWKIEWSPNNYIECSALSSAGNFTWRADSNITVTVDLDYTLNAGSQIFLDATEINFRTTGNTEYATFDDSRGLFITGTTLQGSPNINVADAFGVTSSTTGSGKTAWTAAIQNTSTNDGAAGGIRGLMLATGIAFPVSGTNGNLRAIGVYAGTNITGTTLGTVEGYLRWNGVLTNTFTGNHPSVYEVPNPGDLLTDHCKPGMILCSTGTIWRDHDMENIMPFLESSAVAGSKKIIGVLSSDWDQQKDLSWYLGTTDRFPGKHFHPSAEQERMPIEADLVWNGTTTIACTDTSGLQEDMWIRYLDHNNAFFQVVAVTENVSVTIANPDSLPIPTGSGALSSFEMTEYDDNSYADDGTLFKIQINFTGDGKVWVTNAAGELQTGDLVDLSDVVDENGIRGYGRKAADDIRRSSTVAKVTVDIDWSTAETFTPTSGGPGGDLKRVLVGCAYLMG